MPNTDYKKKYISERRKNINLTRKYNELLESANELNKQVKEYKALTNKVVEMCNAQLDITETYILGNPIKMKGE